MLKVSGEVELQVWKEVIPPRPWPEVVEDILGTPGVEGTGEGELILVVKRVNAAATDAPLLPGQVKAEFNKNRRLVGMQLQDQLTNLWKPLRRSSLDDICRGKHYSWGLGDAQDAAQPKQLVLWLHD